MIRSIQSIPSSIKSNLTKMQQTTIKMFFKPKATENVTPEKGSCKRPAEDEGDGNEADIKRVAVLGDGATPVKEMKSRSSSSDLAIKSTPSKERNDQVEAKISTPTSTPPKPQSESDKNIPPGSAALLTPAKRSKETAEKKLSTPLIDLTAVIRKKIANGAFALHENIGPSWFRALQDEFDKPYFKKLSLFVQQERQNKTVYPPENRVYSWTHYHDIRNTRVIILGQDPYHGPGQAHGLSFSVQKGVKMPPSLVNIFKELESDIPDFKTPTHGDLTGWAKQGVLMLNTCLTVTQGQANSHQKKGWETFTDSVISCLSKNATRKLVYLLWGRPAQMKVSIIDKRHEILRAPHPSPLSAHTGFFGCGHFSKANSFLKSQGLPEIDWKAL